MQAKTLTALGLGLVVAGHCDSCLHLFLSSICNVSSCVDLPIRIFPTEKLSRLIPSITVCTSIKPSSLP